VLPPRRGRSLAVALVLLIGGTNGCGGTGGVPPTTWARSVCGALTPWRTQIADLTARAQRQMQDTRTAEQTKTSVVALLSGAEAASESARRGVENAGVPDVDHGEDIAKRFTTSLAKARDAYGHARTTVSVLPTANASAFYSTVAAAFRTLSAEYEASAVDLSRVGSADLQKAFDEVPECR
jgi:hypothetical protein